MLYYALAPVRDPVLIIPVLNRIKKATVLLLTGHPISVLGVAPCKLQGMEALCLRRRDVDVNQLTLACIDHPDLGYESLHPVFITSQLQTIMATLTD